MVHEIAKPAFLENVEKVKCQKIQGTMLLLLQLVRVLSGAATFGRNDICPTNIGHFSTICIKRHFSLSIPNDHRPFF